MISKILLGNINKNIKYDKSCNGWVFHIFTKLKLKLIRDYLLIYKLKTKKSLSFTKWCKIHDMVLNKTHLSMNGLDNIDLLSKFINKLISKINH